MRRLRASAFFGLTRTTRSTSPFQRCDSSRDLPHDMLPRTWSTTLALCVTSGALHPQQWIMPFFAIHSWAMRRASGVAPLLKPQIQLTTLLGHASRRP
jgi:hypothetical protein